MPGGMHPWMDPENETLLWPYGNRDIYEAYNRVFDCRGHGWSNLQSMHVNLPFDGEDEFVRLHAAIRLVLPLLPAVAASSPCMDGRLTGIMDNRLAVYRNNQRRIPSIAADIVPEEIGSIAEYHAKILNPMYADIRAFDPQGILQEEWLNSRGAIARFERNTIEIRLADVQECPLADLALAGLITETIRQLTEPERQLKISTGILAGVLDGCIRSAGEYVIREQAYLDALGVGVHRALSAREVWQYFFESFGGRGGIFEPALSYILEEGTLAERIVRRCDGKTGGLREIYGELCGCLMENRLF